MKKRFFVLLVFLMFTQIGCGVTSYTPPQKHSYTKTHTYNSTFDNIWDKVVSWYASNGIPIKNIDKSSGFISSEFNLRTTTYYYMDCGTGGSQTEGRSTINVIVKENLGVVSVSVNSFYTCHLQYMGWSSGADRRIDCESTGKLEEELFNFIK